MLGKLSQIISAAVVAASITASPSAAQTPKAADLVVEDLTVRATDPAHMVIDILLTPESRVALTEFTEGAVGRKADIRIDGQLVMSPVITERIEDGRLQVTGSASGSLDQLRERLQSGRTSLRIELADASTN